MKIKVYLGPNINKKGFVIIKGTIFSSVLPELIQEKSKELKEFSSLFLTPDKVPKARLDLSSGNSFLSSNYNKVLEHFAKE